MERIVTSAAQAPAALLAAIALRERGEPFAFVPAVGDPYADAAAIIAAETFVTEADPRARERAYDTFADNERNARGDAVSSYSTISLPYVETLRQCAFLAERVVYRSYAEYFRTNSLLGAYGRPYVIEEPRDATVPPAAARRPDGRIVVWAPGIPAAHLGVVRLALQSFERAVTIVDEASDAAARSAALAAAAAVVCPAHADPGPAIALRAWGIPLCAALSSGAGEYLHGAALYVPANRRSLRDAIRSALGNPAPELRVPAFARSDAAEATAADDLPSNGPPVLVVIRVRAAANGLERTRASIVAQRYAAVTVVEVMATGGRLAREVNAAIRESSAEYVAVIDAGDECFPDHLAALVAALERSGRDLAYAETLLAHRAGARTAPFGYALVAQRPVELASMAVYNGMLAAPLRALIRRTELLEAGGWNEQLTYLGDHELFLRLRKRADFVYVQRVTSRTSIIRDAAPPPEGIVMGEHQLLQLLHPLPSRPAIAEKRAQALAYLRTHRNFALNPPPLRVPEKR